MNRGRILRITGWVLGILLLLALLSAGGFVVWARDASQPTPAALDALASDDTVNVEQAANWIAFQPTDEPADIGYIFYPGGKVTAEAYAPYARAIAQAGYPTYIVRPTLNLAIFEIDAAAAVIDAYPEVSQWVVGGHSLGGSAAAFYTDGNPSQVSGLVLLASYSTVNLTDDGLPVAVIYGSADGLATPEDVESRSDLLPSGAQYTLIEGGNHAQFGDYGPQNGDGEATITRAEQQAQTVAATLDLLELTVGE